MIFQKNQIHAFTPFKLRGKPHSKCKKSNSHKKMVVNLQPQCDFCKDTMHHHEKRGLPRRFTTYFDSFCSNPENDTGLPVIYVVLWECNWFLWNNIPGLSPLKLIIFVKWLVLTLKRYSYNFKTATHSIQTFGLARSFDGKFGHHEKSLVFLRNAAVTAC